MSIFCVNCKTNVNKPDTSKYNNYYVCLNCYIYLTGLNCGKFKNENDLLNNVIKKIEYKNSYFHFYFKLENKLKYQNRILKFKNIDRDLLYNNGWTFYNLKDKTSTIYIYKDKNIISLVSISCIYVYSRNSKTIFKIYDFVDLNNIKYLKYFVKTQFNILEYFIYIYT